MPDANPRLTSETRPAPNQRDGLAETILVQLDQALAVGVFLADHANEHSGDIGIVGAQLLSAGAVDAGVILLE